MSDLNVVYRIAADITGLQDGVNRAAASTERLEGVVASAGRALLGAFSATSVLNAIKNQIIATVEYADAVSNLSVSTGVSIQGLQRLESIGVTSGVTMETLARAVNALNRNLDDKDAQKALRDMNLDYEELRRLSPEEKFLKIARAVSEIQDPVIKANAGAALFNKTWDTIAPAINKNIDSVISRARTLSDAQIAAADEIGDEWDEFFLNFSRGTRGFIADIAAGDKAMNEAGFRLTRPAAPIEFPVPPAPRMTNGGPTRNDVIDPTMISQLEVYGQTLDETIKKTAEKVRADKEAAEASKKLAEAMDESLERMRFRYFSLGQAAVIATQNVSGFGIKTSEVLTIGNDYSRTLTEAQIKTDAFGHVLTTNVLPSLDGLGGALAQAELRQAANATATDNWRAELNGLAQSFVQLAQISGGSFSAISRGIGSLIASVGVADQSVNQLKSGFGSLGAGSTLKGIASIASGIGGIVSVASTAISAVKALWNWAKGGEEGTVVNPARDTWFRGRSVDDIADELAQQGVGRDTAREMIQRVFDARKKGEFDAATEAIDRLIKSGGVPSFGRGGMVTQPTFAMVGESGPELITPLEKINQMLDIGPMLERLDRLDNSLRRDRRAMPHLIVAAWKDALAH